MKKLNAKQLKNVNGGYAHGDFTHFLPDNHDPYGDLADSQSRENQKSTHRWLNDRMQKHNN